MRQDSYAVSELCELFEVPQPALSHHLKVLHQAGLVARRREGNSIFYRRATSLPAAAALIAHLDEEALPGGLARRLDGLHHQRNQRSADFFSANAAEITAQQAEICEPGTYAEVLLEQLDAAFSAGLDHGHVLEVGPGSGTLLMELAGRFERATGVDNSSGMLAVARAGAGRGSGVSLRKADFLELPARRHYDAIVAAMVIHHQASPARFFDHARRLLKASGTLLVAELCLHDQEWAKSACGDQWLGFEPDELLGWAMAAGFTPSDSQYLAQKNGFRVQVHRFDTL
ncbi:MAG: metalloregulator ArsR/SmtB family transcription factor [Pseudomonadota bacterium]